MSDICAAMDDALPWLGLGLSSNLNVRDVPNPYRLRDERPELFDYVEYSAPLELDEARRDASLFDEMWRRRDEVPVLFHPVHLNLYGPQLESAQTLRALEDHLEQVGSPWVSNDVAWWHTQGQPFPGYLYLPPPLDAGGLEDCAAHALHVQNALSVPLLLENPFVLAARGPLHVLDFMAELHKRTGCQLLVDLGHLFSHQLARGLPLMAGLDGFPWEQVVQLHIAGGVVTRRGRTAVYMDDHSQPVREELFALLEQVLPLCRSLRALTFEGDGHASAIAQLTLQRLRPLVPRKGPAPQAAPVRRPVTEVRPPPPERAWATFDWAFTAPAQTAAAAAERDIRLAVLVETLDLSWPCTRLLLAGTTEGLEDFTASAELRHHYETGSQALREVFSAWARRKLRDAPDESVAMVLAFETWMHAAAERHVHREPEPGELTLAEGVAVATFPADLSELVYSVRSLKRHLTQRAWAAGTLETSALDALQQVAVRARKQSWTVALRRRPQGVELVLLEPRMAHLLQAVAAGVEEKELRRRPEEYPPSCIIQSQAQRLLMRKSKSASVIDPI
jgi:uncharacterized protein